MSRPKLGAYIRKINYLSTKEDKEYKDGEETPGNLLIDYERLCNQDENFNFEELKDGYAAFREKVCIPKFTGRHSPPYWAAYSTACVLGRLTGDFEDDERKHLQIGHELLYTWLALFCAKPSSGQLDLMSKFTGGLYEKYIEACKADELVKIMSRMKIKFSYDAKNETDEERTYASFLSDEAKGFFQYLTEKQCADQAVVEAFLDLRIFYQQQISKISSALALYVGYLVRDMASTNIGKPYEKLTNMKIVVPHLGVIEESLCTFEGDLKSLRDEETLNEIVTAARETSKVKELFPALMTLITRFSKRKKPLQNGKRIYDVYRIYLFRDMTKSLQPDSGIFDSCIAMLKSIMTTGCELEKAKQDMISEALSDCLLKLKNLTSSQAKDLLDVLLIMVKSGRIQLVYDVNKTLKTKEYTKLIVWKNLVAEAKQFLVVIGRLDGDQLEYTERREYDEVLGKLKDTVEILLELFKKGKILNGVLKDHVTFIFNCLEVTEPNKAELANQASDSKYLAISAKDEEIVDETLDKVDEMLKQPVEIWDIDRSGTVHNLLEVVIKSYNGSGRNVTDSQNSKFISIFDTCCEGKSIEDKLVDPDEEHGMTVFYRIYISTAITYISLHNQSKTLPRCIPLIKNILKWARISAEEQHEDLMNVSFGALHLVSSALSPELADITPEVVDLFLSLDKVSDLMAIVQRLYAVNPESVYSKLQSFINKMDDLAHSERVCVAVILGEVAGKHAEVFTENQVGKLIQFAIEDAQSQPMYFHVLNQIANQCPRTICKHFTKLQNDTAYSKSVLIFRVMTVVRIACYDKKLTSKAAEFTLKHIKLSDQTTTQQILSQVFLLVRSDRESMLKYKDHFEKLEKSSNAPDVKESCRNIVNAIEGKSIEGVFEDIQQTQEDISDLDKKVGATMNTVVSLGEHVIEQDKDISKMKTDVDTLDERVGDVEVDLEDTKVKVEEIDSKTMTNAPKWSRDLTKLLNPKTENDWRLLAKRLGYSNDDIRAWAQQNDPCMALLSEWYATHKTSEANHGILTLLQEMNRLDGAVIVENAMKASEDVVEDEEFEYPTPPPIFLSYQWGVQNEVKLLKQHLSMAGYECWMDIGQMGGGDKLFNKIDSGIRAAKVIICCTTEKYAQSPNCNREVNLSVNLGKPIIPLLMEKMAWPPKGSMGPIFSEYLFIRFFQRNGEETDDQRYWPIAKFQELLMQMNFFAVPDPKLIKPVYSNWWNPIVEDIKIDKSKQASGTKSITDNKAASNEPRADVSPLIFLSYQWGKQPQVKALYGRLVSLGYTVWMDIFQMGGGDSLYDKIDRGMRGCKVVVSCVTQKYALSANCRREVSLADALKRPIIPLLFESMTWPPDGPMSMIFTQLLYINVCRDPDVQAKWTGPKVEELVGKLKIYIPDIMESESKTSNENDTSKGKQSEKSRSDDPKALTATEKAKQNETSRPKSDPEANTKSYQSNKRIENQDDKGQKDQEKVESTTPVNNHKNPKKNETQKPASRSCALL